ncbi:MAG: sigma factor-like helix-turn-helix DNA-binding protein [Sphaerochaeta associata]|uniref:sigma factor-like helix-turn-helix DNA-binding protein n=1 Tax=Sphaerochaeta associata TaxID=1129264 RepID=UPI002B21C8DF|nr:sigma factor-like helix-turn-helix DNA-binding protein [Sphaerochaeta associata]MEA5106043.1 sigma factor-like helix-turn-helix DNA-binding protein [Sphaerochaeta associata]
MELNVMNNNNFFDKIFPDESYSRLKEYFIANKIFSADDLLHTNALTFYLADSLKTTDINLLADIYKKVFRKKVKITQVEPISDKKILQTEEASDTNSINYKENSEPCMQCAKDLDSSQDVSKLDLEGETSETVIREYPISPDSKSREFDTISPVFHVTIKSLFRRVPRAAGIIDVCNAKGINYVMDLDESYFLNPKDYRGVSESSLSELASVYRRYSDFYHNCLSNFQMTEGILDLNLIPVDYIFLKSAKCRELTEYFHQNNLHTAFDLLTYSFTQKIPNVKVDQRIEAKRLYLDFLEKTQSTLIRCCDIIDIHEDNLRLPIDRAISDIALTKELQFKDIYTLGDLYTRYISAYEFNKVFPFLNAVSRNFILQFSDAFLALSDSDQNVIVKRGEGYTLEEIAEMSGGVTRERIRQIESRVSRSLIVFVEALAANFIDEQYLSFDNDFLFESLQDRDLVAAFKGICKYSEKYEFVSWNQKYYPKSVSSKFIQLSRIVEELVGDGIDIREIEDQLHNRLEELDIGFLKIDDFYDFLSYRGYHQFGNIWAKNKDGFRLTSDVIIKNDFPGGLKLNNEMNEDLSRFIRICKSEYNLNLVEDSPRAICARVLRNPNVILWDPGFYIHIKNVEFSDTLMEEIAAYIETSNEGLQYSFLFKHFESKLLFSSSISNPHALHGVLKFLFPEFKYSLGAVVKQGVERVSLGRQIEKYIVKKRQPVATDELMSTFGVPAFSIEQHSFRIDSVLIWGNGLFNSVKNLKFSEFEIVFLGNTIRDNILDPDGYTTIHKILKYINRKNPTFLIEHEISNRTALFYLLKYYFSGEYNFSNAIHITTKSCKIDVLKRNSVIMHFLKEHNTFTRKDIAIVLKKLNWDEEPGWDSAFIYSEEVAQISQYEFILSNKLEIIDENLKTIRCVITDCLDTSKFLNIDNFLEYDRLPEVGWDWNGFLLQAIISKYESKLPFRIIESKIRSSSNCRSFIVSNEIKVDDYVSLVRWVLRQEGKTKISEGMLVSFLRSRSLLIADRVPKELMNSDVLKPEN